MSFLSDEALERLRALAGEGAGEGGRYTLEEPIARGGMGVVYRAFDHTLEREVAVKVLAAGDQDGELAARMLAEAKIIARLEHPGIVPVHDLGTLPDGRAFYAMRLVRGERLDAHLVQGVPLTARLRIFERICEAVAFAHAHGVIHRDLKPENVMVGPFGEVLVLDWGVAKILPVAAGPVPAAGGAVSDNWMKAATAATAPGTAHGTVLGTPGYMAPEQARGEIERVDERSDVYSLGALLAFLVPGPAPRPLAAIAAKALAPNPVDRYSGAAEIAAEVNAYLAGLSVRAHPEGLLERLGRFVRKYKAPILLVLAYLLMRVALFFWRGL